MQEARVREIMEREIITVQADDGIGEALRLMIENRVSAMPVVDAKDRCTGVLSITDIVGLVRDHAFGHIEPDEFVRIASTLAESPDGEYKGRKVDDLMSKDLVSVDPESSVVDAAREMVRSRVHRLVVVDDHGRAIGVVSTLDLLEVLSKA